MPGYNPKARHGRIYTRIRSFFGAETVATGKPTKEDIDNMFSAADVNIDPIRQKIPSGLYNQYLVLKSKWKANPDGDTVAMNTALMDLGSKIMAAAGGAAAPAPTPQPQPQAQIQVQPQTYDYAEFAGEPILQKLKILSPDGIPTKVGIGVGVAIMAALGYGIYHVVQMRNLEKYGPKNLRQMRRTLAARRMGLPYEDEPTLPEYGGRALNTRQLARLGLI
jgi:hypothetical protein